MKTKSIVTKYDSFCFYCGRPVETEHHLLFGTGMRQLAEEDGIKLPACGEHLPANHEVSRRQEDDDPRAIRPRQEGRARGSA